MIAVVTPRLLLVEDDIARRLVVTAAFAPAFDVVPVANADDPIRAARAGRADLAIVVLSRRAPEVGLRLCRALHSDVRAMDRVGVVDPGRHPRPSAQVMDLWRADGYLGGEQDLEAWIEFAHAVWRGERPVRREAEDGGLMKRLIGRFRRGDIVRG